APGRVRTTTGRVLAEPYVAAVRTRPLEVTAARHVGRVDGQPVFEVVFSDLVKPAEAMEHVRVTEDGLPPLAPGAVAPPDRKVELHGQAKGRTLRFRLLPPTSNLQHPDPDVLAVTFTKGLAGTAGPLGLDADATLHVGLHRQLTATEASAVTPAGGDPHVTIRFSDQVDLEILRRVLSVDPPVKFTLSRHYDNAVRLTGRFAPGTRYAVRVGNPPAGDTMSFPKPGVLGVYVEDRPSAVWFDHDAGYLGAKGNRALLAKAVNVPAVRVSVARVYDNQLVTWRNAGSGRRYGPEVASFGRPIATKRVDLPNEKNAVVNVRLALDELLPPAYRGDGVYRVSVSPERADPSSGGVRTDDDGEEYDLGRGSASTLITLSDVGLSVRSGRDGLHAWAVSLSTAAPLANVRVRAYSDKGQLLGSAVTDGDGLAHIAHVRPAPGEAPAVVLADQPANGTTDADAVNPPAPAGLTWLDLRTSATGAAEGDTGGKAYHRDGYEAFVYADRGVYRPGETVHLRAVVRGANGAVPPTFPLKWQLRRPDLREWKSDVTPLDADGAAGLTLQLPADLPTGRWTAQVGLGGDEKAGREKAGGPVFGSLSFQVEDFIPERLKATAGFAPAGRLPAKGKSSMYVQGDYLFGKPAAGLVATLTARLEPVAFAHEKWAGWTFGDAGGTGEAFGRPAATARLVGLPAQALDAKGRATWPVEPLKLLNDGRLAAGGAGDDDRGEDVTAVVPLQPAPPGAPAGPAARHHGPWRMTVAGSV
ncbi:MAG TPA: MG2 domain-containing protein, partial [Humisphaera sp.]